MSTARVRRFLSIVLTTCVLSTLLISLTVTDSKANHSINILRSINQLSGTEVLSRVLDISETPNVSSVSVKVEPPNGVTTVHGIDFRSEYPGTIASTVFHHAVEAGSTVEAEQTVTGTLPGGGYLTLDFSSSPETAISISEARIPDHESVREIKFVLP